MSLTARSAGSDPMAAARRATRLAAWCCGAAVVTTLTWALWPLRAARIEVPALAAPKTPDHELQPGELNLAAFDVPLCTIAAKPEPPAPPPPPVVAPTPLRLQLLGILRDPGNGQTFRAAVYDPDTDRVTVVGSGDTIAGRTVRAVGPGEISLARGEVVQRLTLRIEPRKGGS